MREAEFRQKLIEVLEEIRDILPFRARARKSILDMRIDELEKEIKDSTILYCHNRRSS